ncbi:MAG: TAXI family TRAP transporter solute-binding subunit [Flavobacteriaceae bacterium]
MSIIRWKSRAAAVLAGLCITVGAAASAVSAERIFFGIATGSTGGVYYPLGGMIAQVVSNNAEVNGARVIATAETGNASVANARLLQNASIEAGMMGADIADQAYRGTAQFADGAVTNLRAIGALFPETVQVVVRADSGIKSFKDLKGKTVSSGPAGSGMYQLFGDVLNVFGMKREDVSEDFSSFSQAVDKLRDGNIDAFFAIGGLPTVSIQDLASSHDIRLLPLSDEEIAKVREAQPYYAATTVPAGTYEGQDEPIRTLGLRALLVTHDGVADDVIYEVTKAIYENTETLSKVHVQGKNVRLETALESVSIPVHPGAKRYYEEKGIKAE